jgi:predicted ATPase
MEATNTHQGAFRLALEHFETALSLYEPERERDPLADVLNPGVAIRCFAGWCLWFVGSPDRALLTVQQAVEHARHVSEPHGLAHAHAFAAVLHQLRRERTLAQHQANAAIALADQHGLVLYGAMARVVRGWASIGRGADDHALSDVRQGLAAWQSTGARLMRPHFLVLLAEALAATAAGPEDLAALDEALILVDSTGECCYEAEARRLRGERLLKRAQGRADRSTGEACIEQALEIASRQSAASLELRAAMSLVRIQRGRAAHARALARLAQSYERFDEGFDTVDLREARRLLEARPRR